MAFYWVPSIGGCAERRGEFRPIAFLTRKTSAKTQVNALPLQQPVEHFRRSAPIRSRSCRLHPRSAVPMIEQRRQLRPRQTLVSRTRGHFVPAGPTRVVDVELNRNLSRRIRALMESQPRQRPALHGDTQTELGERFNGAGKRSKQQSAAPWMTEPLCLRRDSAHSLAASQPASSADSRSQPSRDSRLTLLPVGRDLREACIGSGLGEPRVICHICE